MLPDEIHRFRWIHRGQAVMGIEFDTCFFAQVVNALAVFPSTESKVIPFRWFKGTKALDSGFHFVIDPKQGFFHQHL